jgi:hypothetical protein
VAGNSAYSNEANATTQASLPLAPGSLTATAAGTSQINLLWTDNSANEDSFAIERGAVTGGPFTKIAAVAANITNYSNIGLTANTQYFYRVNAFNVAGNSAYSNEANATTQSSGGNINLALQKPAAASSTDSLSSAARAVDGDSVTYWRSGPVNSSTPPSWLRVELAGSPITVGRIAVTWFENYFAEQFEIQVSNDGTSWATAQANIAGVAGTQNISFTSTTARYIRLYLLINNKGNYRINEFKVYESSVAKAADNGTADLEPEVGEVNSAAIPEKISLAQNYPNPFNPSTTIAYTLAEGMHVSLKVVNLTGQVVATLVEGYRERGIHRVTFKARNLPSGVYYAVLKAGEVTQVQRMTLAK